MSDEIAALETVMAEMHAQWEEVRARGPHKPDVWASHWILIFGGEEWANLVINGSLPIGHVLDDLANLGHQLPPEVRPIRDAWWANIVAYDMTKPAWQRTTPEGKEAARLAAKEWEREQRRRRRAPLPRRLLVLVAQGVLSEGVARQIFVSSGK